MWKLVKIIVNCGVVFGIWRGDKGLCIVQRELSAALVLPRITCSRIAHLCVHWKIYISEGNFAW